MLQRAGPCPCAREETRRANGGGSKRARPRQLASVAPVEACRLPKAKDQSALS